MKGLVVHRLGDCKLDASQDDTYLGGMVPSYWWVVLRRAWSESWTFLFGSRLRIMVDATLAILVAVVLYAMGFPNLGRDEFRMLPAFVISSGVIWIAVFIYKLIAVPAAMHNEQEDTIKAAEHEIESQHEADASVFGKLTEVQKNILILSDVPMPPNGNHLSELDGGTINDKPIPANTFMGRLGDLLHELQSMGLVTLISESEYDYFFRLEQDGAKQRDLCIQTGE